MTDTFAKRLLNWFDSHGRKDLPWQENKTHYRVWISEIMLQQTQVATVIPYYIKFMNRFPTIESLANAPEDDVLAHWAGLGYYARARNLHKAAKMVCSEFDGIFPNTIEEVESLPGIGHSTACAILSIVDNQPLAICDGNVKRVLARYHAVGTPLGEKETESTLLAFAREHMPSERAGDYTQAIMDMGATLCKRTKPNCQACPLQDDCQAYHQGLPTDFPVPKKRLKRKTMTQDCLIFLSDNHIALQKRPPKGVWGSLYAPLLVDCIHTFLADSPLTPDIITLEQRKHVFTHFDLFFTPHLCLISIDDDIDGLDWHPLDNALALALPAPIKTLINDIQQGNHHEQYDLLSKTTA